MKKTLFLSRFLTLWLILSLALSNPAFALRQLNAGAEENPTLADKLSRALKPSIEGTLVRTAAAGAEEKVTVQGPNGLITWTVPEDVKPRLEAYSSQEISTAHILQMFITGWPLKDELLISALNHLSDPKLVSHTQDRDSLAQEILMFFAVLFMEPEDRKVKVLILETGWYFFVHLLVLEQRLEQVTPRTEAVETHLGVIHDAFLLLLEKIDFEFITGTVHTEPKKFYEERLLNLAVSQPGLKTQIGRLLQNWDEWTHHSTRFDYQVFRPVPTEIPDFNPRPVADVLKDAQKAQQLTRQLLELQTLLTPDTAAAAAFWDHPIQNLIDLTEGSSMVIFSPSGGPSYDSPKIELPNAWLFQLRWLDEMGSAGFRRWALTSPQNYYHGLQYWSKTHGDSRTHQEFTQIVQEYLDSSGTIPIRTFLSLPNQQEPSSVTQSVKFLEELRELRQKHGVELKLFFVPQPSLSGVPSEPAFQEWVDQSRENPMLVFGPFAGPFKIPEGTVQIHQWGTASQYRESDFIMVHALPYASHRVGMDHGWGDHESAAVLVRGNEALRDLLAQSRYPLAGINNSLNALVFSSEPDGEEKETPWSPETEAVGLRGPQELVPVGPAAGAEERAVTRRGFLGAVAALGAAPITKFVGMFKNGDANQMVRDESLGARLNVDQGRKETYVVNLKVAAQMNPADLSVVDRILVHPGALIPSAWQRVGRVMVPRDLKAAEMFLAKNARKGDIFLLAPDATGSVESWGNLFLRYGVLGIRTTDLVVATINQLKNTELVALLASLGPQGGLILGAEIQSRTPGERNLLVFA